LTRDTQRALRPVEESTFAVLANGSSYTPPASGLLEYLVAHRARRVIAVLHPLNAEDGARHSITTYQFGRQSRQHTVRLPAYPPYTYPLDLLVAPVGGPIDAWFAFNNMLCARGLLQRRLKRASTIAYWAVDFVPNRFGAGTMLTRVYDAVDAYCCQHADLRIELSTAALEGRDRRHGLKPEAGATRMIAPIGAWISRIPVTSPEGWKSRRAVFIGHLVERMGCDRVIEAAALLRARGCDVTVDIAGRGPLEGVLQEQVRQRGLHDVVRFHGFITDHRELESLLAQAAVALAPYSTRVDSFTRYADPSKLKAYLAAGLPILLTDVPPTAGELAQRAGAEIVPDDSGSLADAIERALLDPEVWQRRRAAALSYVRRFDWDEIVASVLSAAGFEA
jgi:glycosyltransferase involved in cell wall biosynthesis